LRRRQLDVHRHDVAGQLRLQTGDVDSLRLRQPPRGGVGQRAGSAHLRPSQAPLDGDLARGCRRRFLVERDEAAGDEQDPSVVELQRGDDVVAGAAALRPVDDVHLLVAEIAA
jgi:hypothetical protein